VPPGLYTAEKIIEVINESLPSNLHLVRDPDLLFRFNPEFYLSPQMTATTLVNIPPQSNFVKYLGWLNINASPQLAVNVVPAKSLSGLCLPQLGGPQCVNVLLNSIGPQQVSAANGTNSNSLLLVPMSCAVGENAFFQSQDIMTHDIDHSTEPRNYSVFEIELREATTNKPLFLPSVCNVILLLKLYHVDTIRE
jgi:hypothetical protein